MVKDAEVDSDGESADDETIKKSPLSKKPNVPIRYLTSLYTKKRWVSLESF